MPTKRIVIVLVTSVVGVCAVIAAALWIDDARAKWNHVDRSESQLGPGNPPSAENFSPHRAVAEQPAITDLTIKAAADITPDDLADDELVIGVVVDGQARAYSINMLTGPEREIFNDVLGGKPIAVTW